MKLSEIAWKKSYHIYQEIIEHPFNQELMNATLSFKKFTYYLEQDSIYTPAEERIEMLIACKISVEYKDDFKQYSIDAANYEKGLQNFFQTNPNVTLTHEITAATLNYVNHFDASIFTPVEVAVAKVLPCFWFYKELGDYMAAHSVANNPYEKFISSYSGDEFSRSVSNYIDIFDDIGANATLDEREQMIDAFYQSATHEWHFIDDSYAMRVFDEIF